MLQMIQPGGHHLLKLLYLFHLDKELLIELLQEILLAISMCPGAWELRGRGMTGGSIKEGIVIVIGRLRNQENMIGIRLGMGLAEIEIDNMNSEIMIRIANGRAGIEIMSLREGIKIEIEG